MGHFAPTQTGGSQGEVGPRVLPEAQGHSRPTDEEAERAALAREFGMSHAEDSAPSPDLWCQSFPARVDGDRPGREAPLSGRETAVLPTTGPATMPEVG